MLGFSSAAFALRYNNFSVMPYASYQAAHYYRDNFDDVSSLYIYVPADISFNNLNAAVRINPFYSYHYNKLSLAEAFLLLNYKHLWLKAGRQFLSFDNDFFIYLGPDNRYDNPKPSYLDGVLSGVDYDNFKAQLFWGDYGGDNIAGADIKILRDLPITFNLFSYYRQQPDGKLYLYGIGSDIELSENLYFNCAFAFNRGDKTYSVFGMPYTKYYKGRALLVQTRYYAPYKYADFNLTAGYAFTSAAKEDSLAFKSITDYNIYGVLPASGSLFKQAGIKSVKLNLNAIANNLKQVNFDISLFYYYSSDGNIREKYIGSEWDFNISWLTHYTKINLYAGIFSPNKDFTRYQLPKNKALKTGAYISLFNFF